MSTLDKTIVISGTDPTKRILMEIRITANYPATDGSMPESVDVTMEGVEPADARGLIAPTLDMLLMAPMTRYQIKAAPVDIDPVATDRLVAEEIRDGVVAKDASDLAAQMREDEKTGLQPVNLDRVCLRIGCGHAEQVHRGVPGTSTCRLCNSGSLCAGFFGTVPPNLVAATSAFGGEVLAADGSGHVRQEVDSRSIILRGKAESAIKNGDHLEYLHPAGPGLYGAWVRKGTE